MERAAWLRAQPWFTPGAASPSEALFEGRERDALLFVPDTLAPGTAVPLIFNYHGYTGSVQR